MSFAIAAVGTGGHVFPGLAVGEALVEAGVPRRDILYVGGDRLEATVYPDAGFPFQSVPLRGLQRSLDLGNLLIPVTLIRAVWSMRAAFRTRSVRTLLGLGGYVTIPAAMAARLAGASVMVSEQNADAGLGNRVAGWLAVRRFGAFPTTRGLDAEWVGNPVRPELARFDRHRLRAAALDRYGLDPARPVVGIFGGSLGAGVLNEIAPAVAALPNVQLLHIAGPAHVDTIRRRAADRWRVIGFEDRMQDFYAAVDLVVARAGGAVAELSATGTPSVLVPGGFGSSGHQLANAVALADAGSAVVVSQEAVGTVPDVVGELVADPNRLAAMRAATRSVARPDAAAVIAAAMIADHG